MKILNLALSLGFIIFASVGQTAETAGYYRVWQGFTRPDMSSTQFLQRLPRFMTSTGDLYKNKLNNYLVAIPPAHKPSFVPNEFALIALESEQEYQKIRATPEGKAYAESHWEIFARDVSKSLPYGDLPTNAATLVHNTYYNLGEQFVDWRAGHTVFFIGLRRSHISTADFLAKLYTHVLSVQTSMPKKGLRGYIIMANENYEVAYMNWSSREDMEHAFATTVGQQIQSEAADLMETLQWSEAETFNGTSVQAGRFYTTQK